MMRQSVFLWLLVLLAFELQRAANVRPLEGLDNSLVRAGANQVENTTIAKGLSPIDEIHGGLFSPQAPLRLDAWLNHGFAFGRVCVEHGQSLLSNARADVSLTDCYPMFGLFVVSVLVSMCHCWSASGSRFKKNCMPEEILAKFYAESFAANNTHLSPIQLTPIRIK